MKMWITEGGTRIIQYESGARCSIQSITHVCYNIIMNLEPGCIGAYPRGTLLWLWNPTESSSTFAEVRAWSDLWMDKCCLWLLLWKSLPYQVDFWPLHACCFSGHLVCSLLSITSPFTCVLCSRAFLRYLSWLPLWNPVGSSCSTWPRWVQIMQIMHVATCASSLFCYVSFTFMFTYNP